MKKRGQGLPLNTLVIAILVIVVLVLVVIFFLGGFSGLAERTKSIFFGSITGTDVAVAVQQCNQRCSIAESLPVDSQKNSAYCRTPFKLDTNADGEAEKEDGEIKYYFCNGALRIGTKDIQAVGTIETQTDLNIPCTVTC